jgi:surface protein
MSNTNLHNYPFRVNDSAFVINESVLIREGIVTSIPAGEVTSYGVLMNDTQSIENYTYDQLFGIRSNAEIYIQQFLITPTPTISVSTTPHPSRTPKASVTPTPTPSSSFVIYPDVADNIEWTATNGSVIVHDDNSVKFVSNSIQGNVVSFSAPISLIASTNYRFKLRFNEGTCRYITIELDLQDGSPTTVYKLDLQFSGTFQSDFSTLNDTTGGIVTIKMYADSNYKSPALNATNYSFYTFDIIQKKDSSPVPTPTPSAIAQTPYTIQFDSTGIVEVDTDSGITIDWGDGSAIEIVDGDAYAEHTYSSVGTYIVKVYGNATSIDAYEMDGTIPPSNSKILSFGTYNVENIQVPHSVYEVPDQIPSTLTKLNSMFGGTLVFNQDISSWDTSNVTDMSYMFINAIAFNQDISSWNTNNVTNMNSMFYSANIFNQNIGSWDTNNVAGMSQMFSSASAFNQDISSWNTGNVTDMSFMFLNASAFNQDLSHWCVTLIPSVPMNFDLGANAWTDPQPVWGTCPGA